MLEGKIRDSAQNHTKKNSIQSTALFYGNIVPDGKMYPPLESPTSPQDEPMVDLNMLNPSVPEIYNRQSKILINDVHNITTQVKSSDTLRNNIDSKNETTKKRTSLNIEHNCLNEGDIITTTRVLVSDKLKFQSKRNSRALDNLIHGDNNNRDSSSSGASSSSDENVIQNCATMSDVDNRKVRRIRLRTTANNCNGNGNGNAEGDENHNGNDDDDDDDYNDMDNGNSTDSSRKRDSMTSKGSSSDDYFLCEKFKNTLNAELTDAVHAEMNAAGEPMELLSPQEVELGRRYAEISQFKNNKW